MDLNLDLSQAADLATVGVGVTALVLTLLTSRKSHKLQLRAAELEASNQRAQVFVEINALLPKIRADSTQQVWGAESERLRFLAYRADGLVADAPTGTVSPLDYLALANAFFMCWENARALCCLQSAVDAVNEATHGYIVRVMVLKGKAAMEFAMGQPDSARESMRQALSIEAETPGDVDVETDVYTLLEWAGHEAALDQLTKRDQRVEDADREAARLRDHFRRTRAAAAVDRWRTFWAQNDAGGSDPGSLEPTTAVFLAGWYGGMGNVAQRDRLLEQVESRQAGTTAALRAYLAGRRVDHAVASGIGRGSDVPPDGSGAPQESGS